MNIQCCPHNFSEYTSVEVNSGNLRIINASGIYLPAFLLLKVKYTCTIYSFIVKISLSGVNAVRRGSAERAAVAAGVGSDPHKEALLHSSSGECESEKPKRAGG